MAKNIFEIYGDNPLDIFQNWIAKAETSEINDPNAMALATIDENGHPSVRMVLLKAFDARGFVFYTNLTSRKGRGLLKHPHAELNFYWKSIERQIRISGPAEQVSDAEADAYFITRPRESRLGAWASMQTHPMESYETLKERLTAVEQEFPGDDIPRPPHWGGFRVKPERMEFWIAHPYRLHERFLFEKKNDEWIAGWLFP